MQRYQRAAQMPGKLGRRAQIDGRPHGRHHNGVDLARLRTVGRPQQVAMRAVMVRRLKNGHQDSFSHSNRRVSESVQSGVSGVPFSTFTFVRMQKFSLRPNLARAYSALRSRKRASVRARTAPYVPLAYIPLQMLAVRLRLNGLTERANSATSSCSTFVPLTVASCGRNFCVRPAAETSKYGPSCDRQSATCRTGSAS